MGTGVNIYWFPTATTAPTGLTLFRGGPFEGGLWGISEFLHIIDYPLMDFLGGFWQEKCRGGFTFDSLVIPKEIVGLDWKRISVLGGALSLAGSLLGFWGMGRLKAPLRCSFHKIT
jgi:hypothetical protein